MSEFDEFENLGASNHEIYDVTSWDERKILKFINHTNNRHFRILERYLIFICVLLVFILFKIF